MPDQFGFDLLGDRVECVDCRVAGPRYEWPEVRREQHHHEAHGAELDVEVRSKTEAKRRADSAARLDQLHRSKKWIAAHAPRECRGCTRVFTPIDARQVYCTAKCYEGWRYLLKRTESAPHGPKG